MSQAQVRKIDIYEFGPQRLVPWLFEALERPDGVIVLYNDKAVRHLLPEAFELDLRIPKEAPPPSEEVNIDAETQAFVP